MTNFKDNMLSKYLTFKLFRTLMFEKNLAGKMLNLNFVPLQKINLRILLS
jgi:hypothetical protein